MKNAKVWLNLSTKVGLNYQFIPIKIYIYSAPSIPFPHQNGKAMMLSTPSVTYMKDETRQKIYELVNAVRDKLVSKGFI